MADEGGRAVASGGEAELRLRNRLSKLRSLRLPGGAISGELERLERQLERLQEGQTDEDIWRSVELARHQERPYTLDYVERLFEDFVELRGDRLRGDDAAIVTGLARFNGRTVALVGHQKGRDIKERTRRNFGMAYPEGYEKANRVMELADRRGFPVVSLVDTPGAYPGVARRAARAGRRDRPLAGRDGATRRADGRLHHRRGRLGRRDRARRSPTSCSCSRTRSTP